MNAQGVSLLIPGPGRLPSGDIAVLPGPGTPEHRYYERILQDMGVPLVSDPDPLRALALALAHPARTLGSLVIGVDPGRRCGVVALGGAYVLHAEKIGCHRVGGLVSGLQERIPHASSIVLVGDGSGAPEAAGSLARAGVSYSLVPESGSTVNHSRGPLEAVLKDKDLLAGLTIALRGAIRRA